MNQKYLQEIFEYSLGNLYWKKPLSYKTRVGSIAGSLKTTGYYSTQINGKSYKNHRLIFLFHHGYLPECIDHVNGVRSDNRIENLREATRSQNQYNKKISSNSVSKVKNVFFNKSSGKWQVKIRINGKRKNLGTYSDLEIAELVATEARNKFHMEFAKHG
jgi:hypothetical protein